MTCLQLAFPHAEATGDSLNVKILIHECTESIIARVAVRRTNENELRLKNIGLFSTQRWVKNGVTRTLFCQQMVYSIHEPTMGKNKLFLVETI